ncbi:DUF551 domain-containing protein (plasmid) [Escherichia marmotae]|uniref:DUF551 domain-containing protein n=1 Tax=Escherichia marmotae TaxID=1499973 RepID=UPI00182F4CA7|nr:DUF551 domain-containing protein [Escherichia marmotae]HAI0478462.1 DUF551 domain-containing protein [Escherichia coli]WFV29510.1 DUF551 domain-containing protein [Escherichia marmotae]HAI6447614.1 DUF551 domain-containing protein [Escherichia coli]HAI8162830.1 DUF551 domain-containing protein [Escherichia coli]HDD1298584.1 DUF551 domain-containing protein [Escherichia coli]
MTTITRENAEIKSFITGFLSDPAHDNQSTDSLLANVFRIAQASLEAEPVAYIFKHPAGKLFWALTDESNKDQSDVIPVYAAPPVPVVPEEKPMPDPLKMYAVDAVAAIAEVRGWNSCRAAMLHGAEPVSQTYKLNELSGNSPVTPDGWISCSERMPNDAQWCVVNTKYGYYVQCWSEGQGWLGDDISIPECDVINWMPLPEPPQEVNRG